MKKLEVRIADLDERGPSAPNGEVNALLQELKDEKYKNEWFRSPVIRGFLNEHVVASGAVPDCIIEAVEASNQEMEDCGPSASARQRFLEAIDKNGAISSLNSYLISGSELIDSARNGGEVMETFAQHNFHNSNYYFTKFTEWFITKSFVNSYEDAVVVDIGSAYNGFGKYVKKATQAKEINLVDILNSPGRIQIEDRIFQVGSDAAKIDDIPSDYADIVCLHNAIEHFACGSDEGCLRELERILRPGGKALISPFFFEGRYAISLNPISCFFYDSSSEKFIDYLVNQREKYGAILRFSFGMISPYAHVYDYTIIERKLNENCPDLLPKLNKVELTEEELSAQEVFGVPFSTDLYDKPTFFFLELERPA